MASTLTRSCTPDPDRRARGSCPARQAPGPRTRRTGTTAHAPTQGASMATDTQVDLRELLEAGVHFGHQTRRWNPKMRRFIHGERDGIYIIDLQQTLGRIEVAYSFVRALVAGGGSILFVGTKKQAQDSVQGYAEKCGMPYVNVR